MTEKIYYEHRILETIRALLRQDIDSGLKQIEIAKKIGVSQPALYKYLETDTQPTIETLKKFAKAYNLSINELAGNTVNEDQAAYYPSRQANLVKIAEKLDDTDLKKVVQYIEGLLREKESEEITVLFDALSENGLKMRAIINLPTSEQVKEKQIIDTEYFRITEKIAEKTGLSTEKAFKKYIKKPRVA